MIVETGNRTGMQIGIGSRFHLTQLQQKTSGMVLDGYYIPKF